MEFQVKIEWVELPQMPKPVNERIALVKSVLCPYEVDGWKGSFYHYVGDGKKKRVRGKTLTEVTFTRYLAANGDPMPMGCQLSGENDGYLDWDQRPVVKKTWGGAVIGEPNVVEV